MLLIGTLVNLLATFAALIVASQGAPDPVAAIVHFAPLPLNLWLLMVVLRATPRMPLARIVGVAWFVVMTVV